MVSNPEESYIHVEAIMPNRKINISRSIDEVTMNFGIRITNTSEQARLFLLFYAHPNFYRAGGEKIPTFGPNRNVTLRPEHSDFVWIEPGENVELWLSGKFGWSKDRIGFVFIEKDQSCWKFYPFELGNNYIELIYQNLLPIWEVYDGEIFDDIWTGKLTTQRVDFQLI
jgi:hypothetical protein